MFTLKDNILFKRLAVIILFCLSLITLRAELVYVVNSQSRTLSRIDTDTDVVENSFAQLGLIPNKVIIDADILWSVNSGDNALQKIDRQTGATLANILIETGCNPWDAVLHEGYLYVTGLFTNKVYKVNTLSNSVVSSVSVGNSPEALCVYDNKLYVTNTGGWQNNYANSSVSVIDLASFAVIDTIPVSANPQYITLYNGLLHVSCTGNWTDAWGEVCVIDPAMNEVVQTLNLGGSLGNIWMQSSSQALVADAAGINLYRYNPTTYAILNNAANPLANGGSVVDGTADLVAVLDPNWGGNGKVRLLHPDLSYWKEYTVGMSPTDLKLWQSSSASHDDQTTPLPTVQVFPNPARRDNLITFKTPTIDKGRIEIFNIRGQHLLSLPLQNGTVQFQPQTLLRTAGSGCYFYRLTGTGKPVSGKFLLLD
jgi:YVTN family beta-propeller protein